VLLVHGTGATPGEIWGSNYGVVLPRLGYDTCTVALPMRALGDIQVSAEYVVYAIRAMSATYGRKVNILGHSQGPLEPRWALQWWPSLRSQVDHLVMMAAPNHGTIVANALVACSPACLQMKVGSRFLAALNAFDETPGAVSYTSIYSLTDELVQPAFPQPTSALAGATNILMQDLCPGRVVEHVQFAVDAAVFAVVMDAFTHPGMDADPARIDRRMCNETWFQGVDGKAGFRAVLSDWNTGWGNSSLAVDEPTLKPYVTAPQTSMTM
jgi:triacylglycerol lipase